MTALAFHDSVLIGICTFRRPELAATLASLEELTPCGLPVAVAIADNDDQPSARDMVQTIAAGHSLPVTYIHAPKANISIARNALLDHARATGALLLVYLDDDETVEPDWLKHLVQARQNTGAGAILGPVRAHYLPDAPIWMDRARAHDTLPVLGKDGVITSGYTCNVLVNLSGSGGSQPAVRPGPGPLGWGRQCLFCRFFDCGGADCLCARRIGA
ncbi:glycosyltransferase family 2 protein [Paracoccus sp. R86501]|uniref:glycosyltransferase family 2 protein n=1 Tax=Paracoccus sp. R86501 TaxID=3101711 RepID=UPI003672DA6A